MCIASMPRSRFVEITTPRHPNAEQINLHKAAPAHRINTLEPPPPPSVPTHSEVAGHQCAEVALIRPEEERTVTGQCLARRPNLRKLDLVAPRKFYDCCEIQALKRRCATTFRSRSGMSDRHVGCGKQLRCLSRACSAVMDGKAGE